MPTSAPDSTHTDSLHDSGGPAETPLLLAETGAAPSRSRAATGMPLPTGSYWDDHRYLGEFAAGPGSRVLVSAVCKGGEWQVRLRVYRQVQRRDRLLWLHANQLILLPVSALPSLGSMLAHAQQFIHHEAQRRAKPPAP